MDNMKKNRAIVDNNTSDGEYIKKIINKELDGYKADSRLLEESIQNGRKPINKFKDFMDRELVISSFGLSILVVVIISVFIVSNPLHVDAEEIINSQININQYKDGR